MVNGFFAGGFAEGMDSANKQALAEKTLADDTGLRTRALQLQEKQFANVQSQQGLERGDKLIPDTMSQVAEAVKAANEVGKDPATIMRAVQPLINSAKAVAAKIGRDPNALDYQAQAIFANPNLIEKGTAAGAATAAQAVSQDATERNLLLQQQKNNPNSDASADPELKPRYKTTKEKFDAENALRDDFVNKSKEFVTVRDYYTNFKQAESSGAGDITRVFAFMKIMDPGSVVMPGEQANANNAAGVPEAVRGMYNKLVGGGTLSDGARNQISSQIERLYNARAAQHDKQQSQYANIAKRSGLNANNVIIDLGYMAQPTPADPNIPMPKARPSQSAIPAPPAGFILNGQ